MKFSMTDSEKLTPSLYSCFVDIFWLSSTAYELFGLFILAGISVLPAEFVGFIRGKRPPKSQNSLNTRIESTSLRQITSFELSCVEIGSRVWAVRVARKVTK